jgi:hypothetical protein
VLSHFSDQEFLTVLLHLSRGAYLLLVHETFNFASTLLMGVQQNLHLSGTWESLYATLQSREAFWKFHDSSREAYFISCAELFSDRGFLTVLLL